MQRFDFLNRANADYVDRLYQQYLHDPRSLDDTWQAYFAGFDDGTTRTPAVSRSSSSAEPITLGVHNLVHSYRELGHFEANLDPLGNQRPPHALLDLSRFGITEADLNLTTGKADFHGLTDGTLRDLLTKLRATYCGNVGVEYMSISDKTQRDWLSQQMESIGNKPPFSAEESRSLLYQLIAAEEFERFLRRTFGGKKTFSLEGAEATIPLLNSVVDDGAAMGIEEICMGMAHRGRLSVLAHVLNKPYEAILAEFKETNYVPGVQAGDGDVKYHLGYANDRPTRQSRCIHISLSPNPSHLELVNPVVEGIVRAKQNYRNDRDQKRIVPVLIHGDAAFTGQGVVFETLNLSELRGWRTGGTIHIIINNQIGFTTPPEQGRFTPYPTDVAKMIQAPIFHVNGDDPQACVHAARLATAFREQFKCDVFIDIWCYRRWGHNEQDEPAFTQPLMYQKIASHPTVREIYSQKLVKEGIVTEKQLDEMRRCAISRLEQSEKQATEVRQRPRTAVVNPLWKSLLEPAKDGNARTAVPRTALTELAQTINNMPADFTPHPKLKELYAKRLDSVKTGRGIDWGCGEMLALGTLILEGTPIRFTGQDAQRGTFSHRHAVLHDIKNGKQYVPLANLKEGQPPVAILNTMLSELAVVGFEYGFSAADPRNLVLWEAQFGDFVNMAQPIIDQYIAAAESKWHLMNGMVLLLPHGSEGAGPEHSYAYLNRFLSLCAENNLQVCVPTTPSQYFHLLRRQIRRDFRRPLVLMMPKSLLRYQPSFSRIEEFTDSSLQLVLDDPTAPERDSVRRLLFCSGKVFYTLQRAREENKIGQTAIVRVEQLYPFPKKELQQIIARYRKATEIAWVQDEPRNRGAWTFISDRLEELLPETAVLTYYGRDEAASPSTGSQKAHEKEEHELIAEALEIPLPPAAKPAMTTETKTVETRPTEIKPAEAKPAAPQAEPATAAATRPNGK